MKRVIGVVTTTRADYGLYRPILRRLMEHPDVDVKLYVTGTHLSKRFGNTVHEIEQDGFSITARIPLEEVGDTPQDIAETMGRCTIGFARVLTAQRPDILLVLGDRAEMHAAAVAAIPFLIPLAHIHGGEMTSGAIDNYFRHSLTKLASLHFPAIHEYAQRIVQMGEEPWRVIVSGAPAIDTVTAMERFSKEILSKRFGFTFDRPIILVTFHPVTTEIKNTRWYVNNLLTALDQFNAYTIVLTYPNADTGRDIIMTAIEQYVRGHDNAFLVKSLGHDGSLSMMQYATAMVGNSSSGIIEAASFRLPVVNIGSRQEGRARAKNVIDVGYVPREIVEGIHQAMSSAFKDSLADLVNPYGDGRASERIVKTLTTIDLKRLIPKQWYERNS